MILASSAGLGSRHYLDSRCLISAIANDTLFHIHCMIQIPSLLKCACSCQLSSIHYSYSGVLKFPTMSPKLSPVIVLGRVYRDIAFCQIC
jgi:hypothetical protein